MYLILPKKFQDAFSQCLVELVFMKGEIYGGPKYLRMNIGCPQSKLKEGLRRFKIAMDALYSK